VNYQKSILALFALCFGGTRLQAHLPLNDQDNRVVLVGNGFIEQERKTAYLEARLMRQALNHSIICRNLGWSGDSVWGEARPSGFDNPAGADRLVKDATELKPTIIMVGYGFVESFDGAKGVERFVQGYNALLDRLEKITPTLVLLSPTIQEDDPQRSADLEMYVTAVNDIAKKRNLPFVDLFHPLMDFKRIHPDKRLTSNGITLNECGYWLIADEIERQLGLAVEPWHIDITADGHVVSAGSVTTVRGTGENEIKFQVTEQCLPVSASPCGDMTKQVANQVRAANLQPGQWTLKIDGKEVLTEDAAKWTVGVMIAPELDGDASEQFRQAIIDSSELFYRRSRPFNDHPRHFTYIDKDYPLYDQQLAKQDKVIAGLRHPVVHQFEIIRKETAKP
jgi:lysophospholipase L1-like esterase